jgi:hypothetical protein
MPMWHPNPLLPAGRERPLTYRCAMHLAMHLTSEPDRILHKWRARLGGRERAT